MGLLPLKICVRPNITAPPQLGPAKTAALTESLKTLDRDITSHALEGSAVLGWVWTVGGAGHWLILAVSMVVMSLPLVVISFICA